MILEDIPRLLFLALTLFVLWLVLARAWEVRRLQRAARHSVRAGQFLSATLLLLVILAFDKAFWALVIIFPYVAAAGVAESSAYLLTVVGIYAAGQVGLIFTVGRWWKATVSNGGAASSVKSFETKENN